MKSKHAYYNPNPMKITDACDCVLRAYTKAFNITWHEASLVSTFHAMKIGRTFDSNEAIEILLEELGCKRHSVKVVKGSKRPTPDSLARKKLFKDKSLICSVAGHLVTVSEGKYYDTWDSGEKGIYWYYEVTRASMKAMKDMVDDETIQKLLPMFVD